MPKGVTSMIVYHGSDHIVEKPVYNGSKRTNDYGYGFYTTQDIELAREWACGENRDGFVNVYELDDSKLSILRLNSPDYNILNWLAVLTKHRSFWQNGSISEEAKRYLQENFAVDLSPYDLIIGYRADDSYFSFAQDFVAGTISLTKLSEAMRLGKLGEQIVLKSERAFAHIRFLSAEEVSAKVYYDKKAGRDKEARLAYRESKKSSDGVNGLYMLDIMREGMKNNDPRIR